MLQADLAKILETCEDTITGWENGRSEPQIQFYPKIIEFLGYYPLPIHDKSIGGQIKKYRFENGLSFKRRSESTGFDPDTLSGWEENTTAPNAWNKMRLVVFGIIK